MTLTLNLNINVKVEAPIEIRLDSPQLGALINLLTQEDEAKVEKLTKQLAEKREALEDAIRPVSSATP